MPLLVTTSTTPRTTVTTTNINQSATKPSALPTTESLLGKWQSFVCRKSALLISYWFGNFHLYPVYVGSTNSILKAADQETKPTMQQQQRAPEIESGMLSVKFCFSFRFGVLLTQKLNASVDTNHNNMKYMNSSAL